MEHGYFSARLPKEMTDFLNSNDIEIISLFPQNNRLILIYKVKEQKVSRKKPELEGKDNG